MRMLSPDARLYVELARCHCYHSIYLFVSSVLQPCYQCFFFPPPVLVFFSLLFWVAFALMSFILSNAPKPLCGCKQPNTLWCVCVRGNSPNCLCVMYKTKTNVALYGIYIKPEECWYINKVGGSISPKLPAWLTPFVNFTRLRTRTIPRAEKLFRGGNRAFCWSERPASVTASPVYMTRPQAGVITLVPSTVRSGISTAQTDRRRTS